MRNLQLAIDFLRRHHPRSLSFWQLLNNIQKNIVNKQNFQKMELFVDNPRRVKCILLIYSPTASTSLTNNKVLQFCCDEKDNEVLLSMFEGHVPWTTTENISLSSCDHQFLSILEDYFRHRNAKVSDIISCYQMVYPKEKLLEKRRTIRHSYPSEITIRPLSISDANTVNDNWSYRDEVSLDQVKYQIEHLPTLGAYSNGRLISWCLSQYDGSVGMGFTKPECRRFGLQSLLDTYLAAELLKHQEYIFSFVLHDNQMSRNMMQKTGWEYSCQVDWLSIELNK